MRQSKRMEKVVWPLLFTVALLTVQWACPTPVSACIGASATREGGITHLYATMHTAATPNGQDGKTIIAAGCERVVIVIEPTSFTGTVTLTASNRSTTAGFYPVYYTTSATNTAAVGAFTLTASSTITAMFVVETQYAKYWKTVISGSGTVSVYFYGWRKSP